jgi:hypothetical protein
MPLPGDVVLPVPPLELPDEEPPEDEPPEPGYIVPLPPPVLPLSLSVPMGLPLVPELPPDEPGVDGVDSLPPLAPQGQAQLHMPPAPAAPGDTPAPPPVPVPELPEPPDAPTLPAPPGVASEVGAPSAPPVTLLPLPRVVSDCAQLNGLPANSNADNSALVQQVIFPWVKLLGFVGFMISPRCVFLKTTT